MPRHGVNCNYGRYHQFLHISSLDLWDKFCYPHNNRPLIIFFFFFDISSANGGYRGGAWIYISPSSIWRNDLKFQRGPKLWDSIVVIESSWFIRMPIGFPFHPWFLSSLVWEMNFWYLWKLILNSIMYMHVERYNYSLNLLNYIYTSIYINLCSQHCDLNSNSLDFSLLRVIKEKKSCFPSCFPSYFYLFFFFL